MKKFILDYKYIIIACFLTLTLGLGYWLLTAVPTYASGDNNVWGYAWSENIGWVNFSFNEENLENLLVDYRIWEDGQTGSVGSFSKNGEIDENYRIMSADPWGENVVVWEARPEATSGPDGGWNTSSFNIDNTKKYRFSTWVQRPVQGNGHFYLGTRGYGSANGVARRSDGVVITNPYFTINSGWNEWGDNNSWYLVVGHIWPAGSGTGSNYAESGVYDISGNLIYTADLTDYVWLPETTTSNHRTYLYYSTDTSTRQRWVYPRVDVVDGTEPSIQDLLNGYDNYGYDYGVDIDGETGAFSGYAWSENIGWIDFAPSGPYPDVPAYSATMDSETGEVSGWAKALAGEDDSEDGWDGWIKMAGSNYGVTFDPQSGEFSGYAWSDSAIGWVSFNCANESSCATSDYKVMSDISFSPNITNLTHEFIPCSQSRIPVLTWETDAEMPYDYDIRICTDSSCTSELVYEEVRNTSSKSWSPSCTYCCNTSPYNNVNFGGGTYYAQVRVSEAGEGGWSGWEEEVFTTYAHCYPYPDFTCDGGDCEAMQIYEEVVVNLLNTSNTYDGLLSCSWTLPDIGELAEGYTLSDCDIEAIFSAPPPGQRNQDVTLEVTDSEGYSCSETKTLEIRFPLPEYKEVTPGD